MQWIDTHCHLDAAEFGDSVASERSAARALGVACCVLPAVSIETFEAVRALAYAHGDGYCLGIHPLYVGQAPDDALAQLQAALQQHRQDPHLLGVGEIGLDFFVPELCQEPLRTRQQELFEGQLDLARHFDLPVVLHSRRSVDAIHTALRAHMPPTGRWRGIAHAFSGSLQQAQALLNLGLKLGFGGAMTFERATRLRSLAQELPLEALVLETDAPDMPPHWVYTQAGARAQGVAQGINSPRHLPRIAEALAQLRGISTADLAQASTSNACAALPGLAKLLAHAGQVAFGGDNQRL